MVLGRLSLKANGGPAPPGVLQKRRLALLSILAIAGENGISRDRVMAYLWPESSSERSRHALDQLIYAVRRVLGVGAIISRAADLTLGPPVVSSDLRDFTRAIREQRWDDAVACYGGPLLDGVFLADSHELESWIDSERARISQDHERALENLALEAASRGDHHGSTGWWRRLSAADPSSSRIALALMQSMANAGERPAAIRHARVYQDLVRVELGVEPNPKVEALAISLTRTGESEGRTDGGIPLAKHTGTGVDDASTSASEFQPPEALDGGGLANQWRIAAVLALAGATAVFAFSRFSAADDWGTHPETVVSSSKLLDPQARLLYLRGLNSWNSRSKEGLDSAIVSFRRAIEIEPDYAQAYGGLASAYVLLGYSGYRPADAMFPKARIAALRAIELDSTIASAHAALGLELTWERQFASAELAYRRGLSLDPNYATAHQWYGMLLKILGRMDEAVRETGIAANLDPLSTQIQNTYATFLSASGQPRAALDHYQRMIGEEPDSEWVRRNPWLLTNMAAVYAANGMFDKALESAERAVRITPGHPRSLRALALVHSRMGRVDLAREVFAQVDNAHEHYTADRAFFFVEIGELDSAFLYFDKVDRWPIPGLIELGGNSTLGSDPRYRTLLRKLGMLPVK